LNLFKYEKSITLNNTKFEQYNQTRFGAIFSSTTQDKIRGGLVQNNISFKAQKNTKRLDEFFVQVEEEEEN